MIVLRCHALFCSRGGPTFYCIYVGVLWAVAAFDGPILGCVLGWCFESVKSACAKFMDFGLNYWYFCGFVACVLCWLSCIEWRCDDRISVVMLNKLENEPPEARRGAWRGLRANSGALLYKIMRSCMTLSNREHMAAYELLIYVATIWERLYRVVAYELPKGAV